MKAIHRSFAALILLCLCVIPAAGQSRVTVGIQSSQAALASWKNTVFEADYNVSQVSATHIRLIDMPVVSYSLAADTFIHYAYPVDAGTDQCGPGDSWTCKAWSVGTIDKTHVSEIASYEYEEMFKLGWALEYSDSDLWALYQYYDTDFNKIGDPLFVKLVDLDNTAGYIKGRPSLVFDKEGYIRVVYLYHINSTNRDRLMHVYLSGISNTSCGQTSNYQCDPIVTLDAIGNYPLLGINAGNNSRITYYDAARNWLTYAYPQSNPAMQPNCGPGENTWRCVTVCDGGWGYDTVGERFDIAANPDSSASHPFHLLYSFKNYPMDIIMLVDAHYVGSGGNCGEDYNAAGTLDKRWDCTVVYTYDPWPSSMWFSLQVDENNYPILAHNTSDTIPRVEVDFPVARAGGLLDGNCQPAGEPWYCQILFSSGIDSGRQMTLLLNNSGAGFLTFVEDREYEPYLWISQQYFNIFLPMIKR